MGILSNSEIVKALESRDLIIDPPPSFGPEEVNTTYDACSVQLQLDSFLNVPEEDLKLIFDLSQPGRLDKTLEMVCKRVEIPSKGYTLAPGQFVLAQTKQVVGFSGKLSGRIEGRSSFARTGLLVHFTAPTLHAGWKGKITLELLNHGPLELLLRPDLALCQLIVETVEGNPILQQGQFHNQISPTGVSAGSL